MEAVGRKKKKQLRKYHELQTSLSTGVLQISSKFHISFSELSNNTYIYTAVYPSSPFSFSSSSSSSSSSSASSSSSLLIQSIVVHNSDCRTQGVAGKLAVL